MVHTSLVMPVGCGLCPRVLMWQMDVVRYSRVWRDVKWMRLVSTCMEVAVGIRGWLGMTGSWMCLMPKCVSMTNGCEWYPRVW